MIDGTLKKIKTYNRFHAASLPMAVVFLVVMGINTAALSSQPSEQSQKEVDAPVVAFNPHLGTYYYEIHWGALPVATAKITIQKEGAHYRLKADQQTIGLIDRIYRFHFRGDTVVRSKDLGPKEVIIQEQKRRQVRKLKARYNEGQPIEVVETLSEGKKEPKTNTYEISTEPYVIDIYSAILLVRSLDWHQGKIQQFEVFTGKKRYSVTMECVGKRFFKLNKKQIPSWVIRPRVLKLGDPNAKPRYTNARIYLSADESRNLLKIKADIGIGGALVWELVHYWRE